MNTDAIDAKLDSVTVKQLTWKPGIVRTIAVRVVTLAAAKGSFWPEDVQLDDIPAESVNCIGIAYRMLGKAGIIARTGLFRQSQKNASSGRTVFEYSLESRGLAGTFLKRNGGTELPTDQLSLL